MLKQSTNETYHHKPTQRKNRSLHLLFGKQTITVNGEIVSSKFTFIGTTHYFNLPDKTRKESWYALKSNPRVFSLTFDLIKDGEPLIEAAPNYALIEFSQLVILIAAIFLINNL